MPSSSGVKITSSLPDGHGLTAIADNLTADPTTLHVVVAIVDCSRITTDTDTGDTVPTARIRRIEVADQEDGQALMRILTRAHERRTGATVLPLDLENDLRSAFGQQVDPDTGEIG